MLPEVAKAVDGLRACFPDAVVTSREDGEGGAYVVIESLPVKGCSVQSTWVGFRIAYTYPNSDVYPLYVRGDLRRPDGSIPPACTATGFEGRDALQVSRRSTRWDPRTNRADLKVLKVLRWLEAPK